MYFPGIDTIGGLDLEPDDDQDVIDVEAPTKSKRGKKKIPA